MFNLSGKISDALRKGLKSGKIKQDEVFLPKRTGDDTPSTKAIRSAKGQGLGQGATRRRSGDKG